jgi:hypothetical protein
MDIAISLSGHGESVAFRHDSFFLFRGKSRYAYLGKIQIMSLSCSEIDQQLKHRTL